MPRWRKLYAKTLESFDINAMPDDFTRLTWLLLILILDKNGRGIDSPVWIRSKAFPLREDVTISAIARAMGWFDARGMIERYTGTDEQLYFWIPTWHKYQGNTSHEPESPYPAPPNWTPPEWKPPSLKELRSMSYKRYLFTSHWRDTRKRALNRGGHECCKCDTTNNLHVHHLTYKRRGCELDEDLVVLCAACHKAVHNIEGEDNG